MGAYNDHDSDLYPTELITDSFSIRLTHSLCDTNYHSNLRPIVTSDGITRPECHADSWTIGVADPRSIFDAYAFTPSERRSVSLTIPDPNHHSISLANGVRASERCSVPCTIPDPDYRAISLADGVRASECVSIIHSNIIPNGFVPSKHFSIADAIAFAHDDDASKRRADPGPVAPSHRIVDSDSVTDRDADCGTDAFCPPYRCAIIRTVVRLLFPNSHGR